MELIKPVVRVGNSAGVILPKEWLNGKARVELIAKPLNIKNEVFQILADYLDDIEGIYLVGSYARGEETEKSDIDILVITSGLNKKIESGRYEIMLISKIKVEEALKNNVLPILPMLKEAKPRLNGHLIEYYKKTKLIPKNLRWHIESVKSILNVNLEEIKRDKGKGKTGDAVCYSLVLRLREIYIVDCLIKGKMWSTKELLNIIKKVSGSLNAYEGYLRVKNNLAVKDKLLIEEAEKLYQYIYSKIKEQENWLQKRK